MLAAETRPKAFAHAGAVAAVCLAMASYIAGLGSLARRAQIVLYWNMELVEEGPPYAGEEVDEVAWLPPDEAVSRLDYAGERRILARASPPGPPPPPVARGGRVAADVAAVRADVLRRILALGPRGDSAGLGPALDLLDRAEDAAGRASVYDPSSIAGGPSRRGWVDRRTRPSGRAIG